ncbi:MAG: VWA domain-containing protein [Phycisphaerae bacterium]
MDRLALAQLVPFVHPALATAALATGLIPVVIHLINRRRYRRVRWAAMLFLQAAQRRSAKRVWMERWLLLLVRIALIVLFGLALARPYFPASALGAIGSSRAHHILVLDNSLSMNAGMGGTASRFDQASLYAQAWLEALPPGDAVSVVTMGAGAEAVIDFPAYDRRLVRERLATITSTQRRVDIEGACALVNRILNESEAPAENQTIHIVSDLAHGSWHPGPGKGQETPAAYRALQRLADRLPHPREQLTVARMPGSVTENVAVTDLVCASPMVGTMMPLLLTATVTNFGDVVVRNGTLEFRRGGEIIRRQALPVLEPGQSTTASASTTLAQAGTHVLEARISGHSGDALREDDSRFLSLEVRQTRPVLLVDGRPGTTMLRGEAGYLATALAPQILRTPGDRLRDSDRFKGVTTTWRPKVIAAGDLLDEVLSDYDIVALCNVARLASETWQALERFARAGGGLMIFAGDALDLDNYNRFAHRDGSGVLPGTWVPANKASGTPTTFGAHNLTHAIVNPFQGFATSGLFLAQVSRYQPIALNSSRVEVVLEYEDGAEALVASTYGRGRVLTCTTTAGMAWNNLPAKGDYVSLMINAFAHLSPAHGTQRNLRVGETIRERLRPQETSQDLRIAPRGQPEEAARLAPLADGLALEYGPVQRAGAYRALIGTSVRRFVVNVDPMESDLASLDEAGFRSAVDRPLRFIGDAASPRTAPVIVRAGELSAALLCLVAWLALAEMGLAWWFGSSRSTG